MSFLGNLFDYTIGLPFKLIDNQINRDNAEKASNQQFKQNTYLMNMAQDYNTSERLAAQQFTEDFWNKTNAYNLPSEQVSRLRAAGLNPLSQTINEGNSQMIGSSPQASSSGASVSPAQVFPFDSSPLAFAQSRKANAEAQGTEIDNRTRNYQNVLNLYETRSRIKNSDMDTKEKERQIELIDAQITQTLRQIDIDYKRLGYEERNVEVNEKNADTQRIAVGIQSALAESKLKVDSATISNLAASAASLQQDVDNKKISAADAALEFKKNLRTYKVWYDENNWNAGSGTFVDISVDILKNFIPFLSVLK